jgi:hypothetical protein
MILSVTCVAAVALPSEQWNEKDSDTRSWWKSVISNYGVPCCDISDGHLVDFRVNQDGKYEALIDDEWELVPADAVITKYGNPYDRAAVFYQKPGGGGVRLYIRCFIPVGNV